MPNDIDPTEIVSACSCMQLDALMEKIEGAAASVTPKNEGEKQ
jgi:hypothetical protein